MKIKAEQEGKRLAETKAMVQSLNDSLAKLNKNKAEKTAILNDLEEKAMIMQKRLTAASKLITGLGGEQVRWTQDMKNF